jgi:hypothetical protein
MTRPGIPLAGLTMPVLHSITRPRYYERAAKFTIEEMHDRT